MGVQHVTDLKNFLSLFFFEIPNWKLTFAWWISASSNCSVKQYIWSQSCFVPSFITQHIHHNIYPEWRFTCLLTPPVTDVRNRTNLHWSTAKVGASQTGDICLLILWPGPCIYMSLLTRRSTECSFMLAVPLRAALLTSIHRYLPLSPDFVKPPGPKAISFWTCPLVFCGNRLWQFPELNHPRQVITFLENLQGCLKWVKGRRGSHWSGLIHKTLVCSMMLTDDSFVCPVFPNVIASPVPVTQKPLESWASIRASIYPRLLSLSFSNYVCIPPWLPSPPLLPSVDGVTAVINESKSGGGLGPQSNWLLARREEVRVSS